MIACEEVEDGMRCRQVPEAFEISDREKRWIKVDQRQNK